MVITHEVIFKKSELKIVFGIYNVIRKKIIK